MMRQNIITTILLLVLTSTMCFSQNSWSKTYDHYHYLHVNITQNIDESFTFDNSNEKIIRIDKYGNELWIKNNNFENPSILNCSDNGNILYNYQKNRITKIDSIGVIDWQIEFDFSTLTHDSLSYLLTVLNRKQKKISFYNLTIQGDTSKIGTFIIEESNEIKSINSVSHRNNEFTFVIVTRDSSYGSQIIVYSLNNLLQLKWKHEYQFFTEHVTMHKSIKNDCFLIRTLNYSGKGYHIKKINSEGDIIWDKVFEEEHDTQYWIKNSYITKNNDLVLTYRYDPANSSTHYKSNYGIAQISDAGELMFSRKYDAGETDFLSDSDFTKDGGIILAGVSWSFWPYDPLIWLIKTDSSYNVTITNVETEHKVKSFELFQNYPNPFNPNTTISYSLPKSGFVEINIYDMLGREIANLVNKEQPTGNYKIEFNAESLTSGIYFYRLQSGNFTKTRKFILLR